MAPTLSLCVYCGSRPGRNPAYEDAARALGAAIAANGWRLVYGAVVQGTLKAGRLVRLFDEVTMPFVIYSVAFPEHRAGDRMIRTFANWLHEECREQGSAPDGPEPRAQAG